LTLCAIDIVLGSVYDGIYIILDRERAFDNREHGRHVQIVLARLDCLFNIE